MENRITSETQLRELMGQPVHELVVAKSTPVLTPPLQRFIELAPFACLATHDEQGRSDVSPRGDAPGFGEGLMLRASCLILRAHG